MADWQLQPPPGEPGLLDDALQSFEAQLANTGAHLGLDGAARAHYSRLIQALAQELRHEAESGRITWAQAAEQAHATRNAVMDTIRSRSTPVGRALAEHLKREGRSLNELIARKVLQLHGPRAEFARLAPAQQNAIYAEIVASASRSNPQVSLVMQRLSVAGRGLLVLSLALSVYQVAVAEDRMTVAKREAVVTGAGIGGGLAGGALAGLMCGPGAPVCVTVGAFIGGAAAAFGAARFW